MLERAADALPFDGALRLANTGRVRDDHRQTVEVEPHLDGVACRAGLFRDDGGLAPGEGVEQARLAGVRRASEHHTEPIAQDLAAVAIVEVCGDGGFELADHLARGLEGVVRHVALVAEIDGRLDQGAGPQQLAAPPLIELRQRAAHLVQRLAPLCLGLRIDEIGKALDLGQIQLAVVKGAAGELAGFSETAPRLPARARPARL